VRISPPGVVGGTENTLSLSSTEIPVLRPRLRDTRMCVRRQTAKCLQLIEFLTSPHVSVNHKTRWEAYFPALTYLTRHALVLPARYFRVFVPRGPRATTNLHYAGLGTRA
jgi:hypothetical protein